ncbi:unnamed protein product [Blepharisma stoltei]|uniref:GAF domain-containing protein n=1 Tax=Blepharisma stoltei TaxID=1481888 RepID=A0AAU9IGX6_9CILI|nr:unnamed protein product [Blepharisma stoltei]
MFTIDYKKLIKESENRAKSRQANRTPNIPFYEAIKASSYSFNPNSVKIADRKERRTRSIDTSFPSRESINKHRKEDQEIINKLTAENAFLNEELDSMKEVNRNLIEEKINTGEIQGVYHDILVDDLQKQLKMKEEEIEKYKQEIAKLRFEAEFLKKDKKYMRALLKKYKTTPSTNNSTLRKLDTSMDGESMCSDDSHLASRIEMMSTVDKLLLKPPELKKIRPSSFEPLSIFSIQISKEENFTHVLSAAGTCIKETFKCEKATILLTDDFFKRKYEEYHPPQTIYKSFWGSKWIYLPNEKNLTITDTDDIKPELSKKGFSSGDFGFYPVFFQGEVGMIIKAEKKLPKNGKMRIFTPQDLKALSVISNILTLYFTSLEDKQKALMQKQHVFELTNIAANLLTNRSYKDLANKIYNVLPSFFEFERAGIVFVDEYSHEFFTMVSSGDDHEKYSDRFIQFPLNIGVSGEVYKTGDVCHYHSVKNLRFYNPEIDNVASVPNLRNCLMGCMLGHNDKVVGILQLGNKMNGKHITENDIKKMKSVQKLIGMCISTTNVIVECLSLTISFKSCIESVACAIESISASKNNSELNELRGQLFSLRSNMFEAVRRKNDSTQLFNIILS